MSDQDEIEKLRKFIIHQEGRIAALEIKSHRADTYKAYLKNMSEFLKKDHANYAGLIQPDAPWNGTVEAMMKFLSLLYSQIDEFLKLMEGRVENVN